MHVRDFAASDLEAAYQLLVSSGWSHRVSSAQYLQRLVAASQRTAVASLDGQVIGFARAITDGISNGYLSMIVVADTHRRRGAGKALVDHIVGTEPGITWVLRAGRSGASEFFAKLGFVASTDSMGRQRR